MQRFLELVPTIFAASILVFLIIQMAPGDPVAIMLGTEATPDQIARARAKLGLDKPLITRYTIWLSDVVRLDLGNSLVNSRPVVQIISEAFPHTALLAVTALFVSIVLGFPLGILAAIKQDSHLDTLITALSSISLSVPGFWLGMLLILVFSVHLNWLPSSGIGESGQGLLKNSSFLIMPVTSIAIAEAAVFTRFLRSTMIDVIGADYIRTARAKGLVEQVVIRRHALRNALLPVVTIIGIEFGRMLGGAVIIESVFSYSGMGRLAINAILNRDYPVIQGVLLVVVLVFLITNLLVDVTYAYLDPRVTFEKAH
jgi:peptide/nickel transport system permease protein